MRFANASLRLSNFKFQPLSYTHIIIDKYFAVITFRNKRMIVSDFAYSYTRINLDSNHICTKNVVFI